MLQKKDLKSDPSRVQCTVYSVESEKYYPVYWQIVIDFPSIQHHQLSTEVTSYFGNLDWNIGCNLHIPCKY